MGGLRWRFLGPYRGGRVMAVVGHPSRSLTGYFGSTGGGVWRTNDGGTSWHALSDRQFKRASVGALAIAPSDPAVLYAGMGECGFRSNVTHGDGIYRSQDGGASWEHLGLAETQNIGRIRVHPRDPDLVYLAAMGHRFGPNPERGIFRTRDGGRHWDQILSRGPGTGAIDLAMDPSNPRILYAALWQAQRYPWGFATGGPHSGIFKAVDGGATWRDLSRQPGMPVGIMGKIALTVSPARPERLYAIIAAPEGGGIYRSSDGGETWTWTNDDANFLVRGWYETRIEADPRDADTVWLPNRKLWRSTDGGRTFAQVNTSYWDQHDIWIDPRDPQHLMLGNDGGASVSHDGGVSWSSVFNQPTAELYHASTDTRFPYRIYSAQQDSSTLSLPSRSDSGPISEKDWFDVGGGESAHIAVKPDDPAIVFASDLSGVITRYDHRSGQVRNISPWPENLSGWPATRPRYRFNWSTPLLLSRHEPGALYLGASCLLRTDDDGHSWRAISPDLTRHDPAELGFLAETDPLGRWRESGEDDEYATIASVAEGNEPGILWTGSDDGVVSVSRDGGASWADVTPHDLPIGACCCVEASPHQPGGAYLAATRHRLDDFRPYIFRTVDYGAHWQPIAGGIPDTEFVRVVRADPGREGLLYCGTEAGVFLSRDNGTSWQALQYDLPACAVYDLAVHEGGDLIAATHGRGLWIMDDITPLRHLDRVKAGDPLHLFPPRPAYRVIRQIMGIQSYITMGYPDAAENPPAGIEVSYLLLEPPQTVLTLTLLDDARQPIAAYRSTVPAPVPAPLGPLTHHVRGGTSVLVSAGEENPEPGLRVGKRPSPESGDPWTLPAESGLNRFVVPLLSPGAPGLPGYRSWGSTAVPLPPGRYVVRMTLAEVAVETTATVLPDPRSAATSDDYAAQFALLTAIRDLVARIHATVMRLRDARRQITAWTDAIGMLEAAGQVRPEALALIERLAAIEDTLAQPQLTDRSGELAGSHIPVKLDGKLETLASTVSGCDAAPTTQADAVFQLLSAQAKAELEQAEMALTDGIATLNSRIREATLPAIARPI